MDGTSGKRTEKRRKSERRQSDACVPTLGAVNAKGHKILTRTEDDDGDGPPDGTPSSDDDGDYDSEEQSTDGGEFDEDQPPPPPRHHRFSLASSAPPPVKGHASAHHVYKLSDELKHSERMSHVPHVSSVLPPNTAAVARRSSVVQVKRLETVIRDGEGGSKGKEKHGHNEEPPPPPVPSRRSSLAT